MIGEHDPRGSIWRRWDPHVHAPGTVLNDQFGADSLDAYLTAIETAGSDVVALGVTDYPRRRVTRESWPPLRTRVVSRL